ncbi:hypothetical protein P154DRAFT_473722 [Amniculicola lignicola CBS 123094]|uniref:F-box domain-containing protein n=1 Tax=Amniculicola lignicola CBS 123094 TaxID=1392246 RepID=A0A6A5W6Q8_9PLEO|nr:hypothetical protein P154DRAFT_473722 [Amniculicola lignicola CBS 123094]
MDDLLPSYESVIHQNPWELVAGYLPSNDLCSAALVCQKWHETFTPQLWGDPASHFGVQNDTVYVALTRFKRTLLWSRLFVRELTHTLRLPPAHAELYGGPHYEWLRDCLERLPRLQSLIVNSLPFFDHAALLTLRHPSVWWKATHTDSFPRFGLRLLDASACSNATSNSLSEALPHFPDLVSLDLSRTTAAKDGAVLNTLKHLPNLRVLKLRGLGLKDSELRIIATSITTRVRSLDISENFLTDASARLLLEHCLQEIVVEQHSTRMSLPPVHDSRPLGELDIFGTENLETHLRKKLTTGFIGSLAIEDARGLGVTHLYISQNNFTVEGISDLLRSKRLQVLDMGTLYSSSQQYSRSKPENSETGSIISGVEELTLVLADFAAHKLVYLRINFAVITKDAPISTAPCLRAELIGDIPIYKPTDAHELGSSDPPLAELDATNTAVYELPTDANCPSELPVSSLSTNLSQEGVKESDANENSKPNPATQQRAPVIEVTAEPQEVKRGPAYAPEPVFVNSPVSPSWSTVDGTGGLSPILSGSGSPFTIKDGLQLSTTRPRENSVHYVEERRARLELRQSRENILHPGMLPKVRTLVLSDVPITGDALIVHRLIQFIRECAEEAEIARIRAMHTYALPPGRSRKIAERDHARSLFALGRIVLEMAPPKTVTKKISTSWREYPTKSSTEDADSEAFWNAATYDFSFFGDEEVSMPTLDPGHSLPLAAMSGLMLADQRPVPVPKPVPVQSKMPTERIFDVVAEIAKFRKERKAAYDARLQLGEVEPFVEGYWPGNITVIRPVNEDSGDVDYYGNRFESGWLYR